MATFVLVHGGFHGGWSFQRLAPLLRRAGHDVYAPTLTGLAERSHLSTLPVNLDLHIEDIVNLLLWEDLNDVILLGHSYGGMVVTGVADRVPERIRTLVYLDALVPQDGDTLLMLRPDLKDLFLEEAGKGQGRTIRPFPAGYTTFTEEAHAWIDAMSTPHPFACFLQAIRLTGGQERIGRRVYIYAVGGFFDIVYEPYRDQPGSAVFAIADSGHSIMIDQPGRVADILLAEVGRVD